MNFWEKNKIYFYGGIMFFIGGICGLSMSIGDNSQIKNNNDIDAWTEYDDI